MAWIRRSLGAIIMWGAMRNRDYRICSIFSQNISFEARSPEIVGCVLSSVSQSKPRAETFSCECGVVFLHFISTDFHFEGVKADLFRSFSRVFSISVVIWGKKIGNLFKVWEEKKCKLVAFPSSGRSKRAPLVLLEDEGINIVIANVAGIRCRRSRGYQLET